MSVIIEDKDLESKIETEAPLDKDCYEIGRKIFHMSINKFFSTFIDTQG